MTNRQNDKQTCLPGFPNQLSELRRTYVRTHTQPIYTGAQGRLDYLYLSRNKLRDGDKEYYGNVLQLKVNADSVPLSFLNTETCSRQ